MFFVSDPAKKKFYNMELQNWINLQDSKHCHWVTCYKNVKQCHIPVDGWNVYYTFISIGQRRSNCNNQLVEQYLNVFQEREFQDIRQTLNTEIFAD